VRGAGSAYFQKISQCQHSCDWFHLEPPGAGGAAKTPVIIRRIRRKAKHW
jgi:hypothetical protein